VPQKSRIFNEEAPTIVFTKKAPENNFSSHIEYIKVPFDEVGEMLNLKTMLGKLYEKRLQSLIVEGGSSLLNSFVQSGIWDEMRVETATELTIPNGIPAPQISGHCVQKEMIENHIIERFINTLKHK